MQGFLPIRMIRQILWQVRDGILQILLWNTRTGGLSAFIMKCKPLNWYKGHEQNIGETAENKGFQHIGCCWNPLFAFGVASELRGSSGHARPQGSQVWPQLTPVANRLPPIVCECDPCGHGFDPSKFSYDEKRQTYGWGIAWYQQSAPQLKAAGLFYKKKLSVFVKYYIRISYLCPVYSEQSPLRL